MKTRLLQTIKLRWMEGQNINVIRFGVLEDHYDYFCPCQIFIFFYYLVSIFLNTKNLLFSSMEQWAWISNGLDIFKWEWLSQNGKRVLNGKKLQKLSFFMTIDEESKVVLHNQKSSFYVNYERRRGDFSPFRLWKQTFLLPHVLLHLLPPPTFMSRYEI